VSCAHPPHAKARRGLRPPAAADVHGSPPHAGVGCCLGRGHAAHASESNWPKHRYRIVCRARNLPSPRFSAKQSGRTRKLTAGVHAAQLAAVIRGDADPHAAQWHRELVSAPGARAWLYARPSLHPGFYMSPAEGRAALALYARIPLFRAQRECGAGKNPMDVHGHHALACRSNGMPIRK
jgi:hypothetical protein